MMFGSLHVAVVDEYDDVRVRRILRLNDDLFGQTWEDIDTTSGADVAPTFRLPAETGRALLDALAHHYEGGEDTRRLRADYDAALKRADAKDAVIADVLKTLAGKVGA
jgi:hypothetical protein